MPRTNSRPTVLLVEDDPSHVEIVRRLIERLGDRVGELVARARLSEAIEFVRSRGADLVLLDLRLPDSESAQTLERIPAFTDCGARVVALSSLETPELAAAARAHGACAFLEKGSLDDEALARLIGESGAPAPPAPSRARDTAPREREDVDVRDLAARFAHDANSWLTILGVRIGALRADLHSDDAPLHLDALREGTDALVALVAAGRALVADELGPCETAEMDLARRATSVSVPGVALTPLEEPARVDASSRGVEVVLDALAANASDAAEEGPARLALRRVASEPDRVVVDAVDDGGPWDVLDASRLTDPFVAGRPGSLRAGLGLFRARRWMERMGGSLEIVPRDDAPGAHAVRLTFRTPR